MSTYLLPVACMLFVVVCLFGIIKSFVNAFTTKPNKRQSSVTYLPDTDAHRILNKAHN